MWKIFRRRTPLPQWRVRSRSEYARGGRPEHIDITPLAPPFEQLVGNLVYIRLEEFAQFAGFLGTVPDPSVRGKTADYANELFETYSRAAGLQRSKDATFAGMTPEFALSIDTFEHRTACATWPLALLKSYLVLGMVDDFVRFMAAAVPIQRRALFTNALHHRDRETQVVEILLAQIAVDANLQDALALTGRRIVGDTLLLLRQLLELPSEVEVAMKHGKTDDADITNTLSHIDAAIAEVIVEHTLRMDKLGLTA